MPGSKWSPASLAGQKMNSDAQSTCMQRKMRALRDMFVTF